jgi:hypothetical protein
MKRKIRIGRRKYEIKRVNEIEPKKKKKGTTTVGMIIPAKKTILIKKIGKNTDNQTLFHELAHGIALELTEASARGIKLSKTKKDKNTFLKYSNLFYKLNCDEGFIDYFGSMLNRTFKLK